MSVETFQKQVEEINLKIQELEKQYSRLLNYLRSTREKLKNIKFEIVEDRTIIANLLYQIDKVTTPTHKVKINEKEVEAYYTRFILTHSKLSKKHSISNYLHVFKTSENEVIILKEISESYVHRGPGKTYSPIHGEDIIIYINNRKQVFFEPSAIEEEEFPKFIKILKQVGVEQKQLNFVVAIYKQYREYYKKLLELSKKKSELLQKLEEVKEELERQKIRREIDEKKKTIVNELTNLNIEEVYERLKQNNKLKLENVEIEVRPTLRPEIRQVAKIIVKTFFGLEEKEVEVEYKKTYIPNLRAHSWEINFDSEKTKHNVINALKELIQQVINFLRSY